MVQDDDRSVCIRHGPGNIPNVNDRPSTIPAGAGDLALIQFGPKAGNCSPRTESLMDRYVFAENLG